MTLFRSLISVLTLILLSGCYAVYSTQPVGSKPMVLEPKQWEGVWVHRDMAITVMVADSARGLLEVGWVEKKQGKLVFEKHRVELRRSGEWIFGNVRPSEKPKLVAWGRVLPDEEQVVVWLPDRKRFEELVRNHRVAGRNEKAGEDVILTEWTEEALNRLKASEGGLPLEWERPLVFRRLSR